MASQIELLAFEVEPQKALQESRQLMQEFVFQHEIFASISESNKWYFYPEMNRDEVLMFKTYDSDEQPFIPTLHSAFDHPETPEGVSARESIEVRAVCFFD